MKKQNKQTDKLKKITIIFGYILFALLVTAVTVSTVIPMGQLLLNPAVLHFNVAVMLISLVAGAVLPLLISYLIGDKATHSKSEVDHHFNGVLFGIAAYWLSLFFFFIGSDVVSSIRNQFTEPLATAIAGWPILATLLVVTVVAVWYVKNQKNNPLLLDNKLYQYVLFAGLSATFIYMLSNQYLVANALWSTSLLYVVIPVILIGVCYIILPTTYYSSSISRLTGAVVAVSIGYITMSVAGQLLPLSEKNYILIPTLLGIASLILYLYFARRTES